jgi:hypothetical protein
MKKSTFILPILLFIFISISNISYGQKVIRDTTKLNALEKISAIEILKKPIFKNGENKVILFKNKYSLYVKLVKNKTPYFFIKSPTGKTVHSEVIQRTITCWRCFVSKNGDRNCIEIPCPNPDDMRPWSGTNTKAAVLR